jgi:hypothetical protein
MIIYILLITGGRGRAINPGISPELPTNYKPNQDRWFWGRSYKWFFFYFH